MAWRDFWGHRRVRWAVATALGGVWWSAVLRLALEPAHSGPVQVAVAAGGWGLSLLPVHCVPRSEATARRHPRVRRCGQR